MHFGDMGILYALNIYIYIYIFLKKLYSKVFSGMFFWNASWMPFWRSEARYLFDIDSLEIEIVASNVEGWGFCCASSHVRSSKGKTTHMLYIYIYIYIYTYIYTEIHTYIHISMKKYIYIYTKHVLFQAYFINLASKYIYIEWIPLRFVALFMYLLTRSWPEKVWCHGHLQGMNLYIHTIYIYIQMEMCGSQVRLRANKCANNLNTPHMPWREMFKNMTCQTAKFNLSFFH